MRDASNQPARVIDLARLTSLRAFAALAVFGFHAGMAFDVPEVRKLFGLGYAGVGFFFVLSGFVLTWATRPDTSSAVFYRRRFARVYPAYLVSGLIAGVVLGFGPPLAWFSNLLMVHAWIPSDSIEFGINGVSWSLVCEAFFYLLWPVFVVWARRRLGWFTAAAVLAFLLGTAVTAAAVASETYVRAVYVNPAVRLGEFLLGIALAVWMTRGRLARVPLPLALAVLAVNWYVVRLYASEYFPLPDYLMVPSYVLLIWSAATADLHALSGMLTNRLLVYAGQVSFCFYLVHQFGIDLVLHLEMAWPPIVQMAAALVIAFAFAAAMHHVVELPAQRRLSRSHTTPAPDGLVRHSSSSAAD